MIYALRQLAKNPGFAATALATLALAIGLNTSAFTVLNRFLLQSLPYRNSERLVQVWFSSKERNEIYQGSGDYVEERAQATVFEEMAAYNYGPQSSVTDPGQPAMPRNVVYCSANVFSILGIQPEIGRLFTEEEAKRFEWEVLLSNAFWREHYAADPKVLGHTLMIQGKAYTIIGVMPPLVDDPMLFDGPVAAFPLDPFTLVDEEGRHGRLWYRVVGRLKAGVSLEQAQAEMTVIARRLAQDHPKTNKDLNLRVIPFPTTPVGDNDAKVVWLVFALCGFILLIGCANLANLQIVRTTRRGQELSIRLALGCSRARLVGMLIVDSLLLSIAGGGLGLLVAALGNAFLARFFEVDMPLDLRVLGFALVVSLATGLLFGTVPALLASRADIASSLKAGSRGASAGRSRHRLRQSLVVAELALASTLLAGAGFLVSGIYNVTHRDLGWNGDHVLFGGLELDHDHFGESNDPRSLAFGRTAEARLRALPGVDSVTIGGATPVWGFWGSPIRLEGQPVPEPGHGLVTNQTDASPDFFRVYGIRIIEGRNFRDSDGPDAPRVAIINVSLAKKAWPNESPLGKRIGTDDPDKPDWAEVVGVMADYRGAADFYDPSASGYRLLRPFAQNNFRYIRFGIRTLGPPEALKDSVRKTMAVLAPDFAVSQLRTIPEIMKSEVGFFTFLRRLLLQIAALGLLLASIGLYGVVAALVSERTREVGIRMALGANPRSVIWLFLKSGVLLSAIGAALGLAASLELQNVLGRMLPVLPGKNPSVLAGMILLLVVIAVMASLLPAMRATKCDPLIALRAE